MLLAVYGLPLAGCAVVAWLAWRVVRVVARRDLPPAACNISSAYYPLGTWVYVWGDHTKVLRHCRVADVSHPRDVARHRRTTRVIELGYTEAQSLCGDAGTTVVHLTGE